MNINFPAVDAAYIKSQVENGYYSNATEMVRDAVRHMRQQDGQHSRLLGALEIGERDIAAGRTVPYTSDLLDEVEQEARAQAAKSRPTSPNATT